MLQHINALLWPMRRARSGDLYLVKRMTAEDSEYFVVCDQTMLTRLDWHRIMW